MEELNLYGDSLSEELSGYGVDISMQRADSLDLQMLSYVESLNKFNIRVADLGCGRGGQSLRLAIKNCDVTSVDIQNFSKIISENCSNNNIPKDRIRFIKSDIRHTSEYLLGKYNLFYSQRTLHYIDYHDAEKLLKVLNNHLVKEQQSKLYLSVSGLNSELGENYEDRNKPIKYRFCQLDRRMRAKHKILLPVCLYREDELESLLLKCKFAIDNMYTSDFGNVKAIATPIFD